MKKHIFVPLYCICSFVRDQFTVFVLDYFGPNRSKDIKKRWQEYTEELSKKDLHDLDNHNGVITHPEPDILECEVKWAFRKHHYEQS